MERDTFKYTLMLARDIKKKERKLLFLSSIIFDDPNLKRNKCRNVIYNSLTG